MNKALIITFIFFQIASIAADKIIIGYFQLPPHSHYENANNHEGIAHEYFKLIANEMKLSNYEFKELPLPRLISDLTEGKIDIGLYLAKNEARQKLFHYAKKPLFIMAPSVAMISNKMKKNILSSHDVKDLNVCVWQEGYISDIVKSSEVRKVELTGLDITSRCLDMVSLKRADAFYTPDLLSLRFEIKKLSLENKFEIKALENSDVGLYSVFSKRLSKDIIDAYDKALDKVEQKNNYENFYYKKLGISN